MTTHSAATQIPPEPVTLNNCENEPIQFLGEIQPFAFLLAFSREGTVVSVSANVERLLQKDPDTLLGGKFDAFLPRGISILIREKLSNLEDLHEIDRHLRIYFSVQFPVMDISIHRSGPVLILECEQSLAEPSIEPIYLVKNLIAQLKRQPLELAGVCNAAVLQLNRLTGFDRVMIYRFDPDGSGEVFAEAAETHLEKFIGLHYPAADIPAQARVLYKKNLLRTIESIHDIPVPLVNATAGIPPIDLTYAFARSVSPIHIEYLKNMGVDASMSISIIVDGKLWGLFALHHYSKRRISLERRSACELYSELFSFLIATLEFQADKRKTDYIENIFSTQPADGRNVAEVLLEVLPKLKSIFTFDGCGLMLDKKFITNGLSIGAETCQKLLASTPFASKKISHSDKIMAADSADNQIVWFNDKTQCGGFLAVSLSPSGSDFLILLRKEVVASVTWAGAPEKTYEVGPNGPRLSPRKSFEAWTEEVSGKSQAWLEEDIRLAAILRSQLVTFLSEHRTR